MFAGLTSMMSSGAHAAAAHAIYEGFTVCDKTREFGHGLLVGLATCVCWRWKIAVMRNCLRRCAWRMPAQYRYV
jgi:glycerol dehydrogenase-like iron-containing ADH family enzyme